VDLLNNGVSNVPDYSEQVLNALDESNAAPQNVLAGTSYPTTSWYALTPPNGVGSAATHHCDGTPKLPNETMYRVNGPTGSISWSAGQDINFDGNAREVLRGYDDWANIDPRQIGAAGSNSVAGIGFGGSGGIGFAGSGGVGWAGSGGIGFAGSGGIGFAGSGGIGFGGSGGIGFAGSGGIGFAGSGGVGNGEITFEVANSVVRPPGIQSATLTPSNYVQLNLVAPSFGVISAYHVYRAVNGGTATIYATVSGNPLPTTYTDQKVGCATYTYFVTAVLADGRESVPSNSTAPITVPCVFTGFLSPLKTAGDSSYSGAFEDDVIPIVWQIGNASTDVSVNTVALLEYFTPLPKNKVCPLPSTAPGNYTVIPLYSPSAGVAPSKVKPNNTFTYDTKNNQFIFKWNSEGFNTGCYIIELDLRDGQVKRTSLRLFEQ
jgi:hypothetical protein